MKRYNDLLDLSFDELAQYLIEVKNSLGIKADLLIPKELGQPDHPHNSYYEGCFGKWEQQAIMVKQNMISYIDELNSDYPALKAKLIAD